jgi:hypothetical protein
MVNDEQIGGDHYRSKSVQPWEAMEAWMSHEQWVGFLRGNAIKYLARAGSKGDALEDYKKGQHYLVKLIEVCQNKIDGVNNDGTQNGTWYECER